MAIPLKVAVHKGSELVAEHSFDRDIIKIGRLASAHLKLDDPKVSRIHAVIEVSSDGEGYSIIDMGSSDGTFVNSERISKEKLKDGDEITVGESTLVITLGGAEEALPVPAAVSEAPPEAWAAQGQWDPNAAALAEQQTAVAAGDPNAVVATQMTSAQAVWGPQGAPQVQVQADGGYAAPMQQHVDPGAFAQAGPPPQWDQPSSEAAAQHAAWQAYYEQQGYPPDQAAQAAAWAQTPEGQAAFAAQQNQAPQPAWGPWGAVPNNLASANVPDTDRALEVKAVWGNTVLESVNVTTQPMVTMGDEPKTTGWGPFQKFVRCDIDVPSLGLSEASYPLAVSQSTEGANYGINIHDSMDGYIERVDGTYLSLDDLRRMNRLEPGDAAGAGKYSLQAEETLYLHHAHLTLQMRYVRKTRFVPPPWLENLNYTWVNILILAFFAHVLAVSVFVATPRTSEELTEALFKNPNRFASFKLKKEEKKDDPKNSLLSKLKAGPMGAKARGKEGKAGRKDYKGKKQGRMAVKGDPDDKEIAKSTLAKLFGAKGNTGRSYLFGTGGLGGELKGALGGVTGAEIGDASGLGGLGTRGQGPGGGGLSMNSVGLGALGTHGYGGGGDGSYGSGVGRLGKKVDRDIRITPGRPVIMGSLDKELIRRVINAHRAQIRYCYEKELVRTPGIFGKVNVEWVITAEGSVRTSKVKESTLSNKEVGRCVASKIRTWKFPKPKGGGIVIVRYPFVFKTSG